MKVHDVMTPTVVAVREHTMFREIVHILLTNDVSGVPVLDEAGSVIGIVSEEDLIAKEAYPHQPRRRHLPHLIDALLVGEDEWIRKAEGLTAADVMSKRVLTIGPGESVHDAARRMMESRVKRLPVVENGHLVGIISRHDVLRVFARRQEELKQAIDRLLRRCAFVPPDYEITVTVNDGLVGLDGHVLYESDIRIVEDLVVQLDGIVGIANRLRYRYRDPKSAQTEEPASVA